MLDSKELKTIISYLERAVYKYLEGWVRGRSSWSRNSSDIRYEYYYKSSIFNMSSEDLFINIPTEYYLSKGRLSITKHKNNIYFGVEKLIKERIDIDGFRQRFCVEFESNLYYVDIGTKLSWDMREKVSNKAFDLWSIGGGFKRMEGMIKSIGNSYVRYTNEIPCEGLNKNIIPVVVLDLEDLKVKYLTSKSSDIGCKLVSKDLCFNKGSMFNDDFLRGLELDLSMFHNENVGNKRSRFPLNKGQEEDLDSILTESLKSFGYSVK